MPIGDITLAKIKGYILECTRCGKDWEILAADAEAYRLRIEEGVCWKCEPEGW